MLYRARKTKAALLTLVAAGVLAAGCGGGGGGDDGDVASLDQGESEGESAQSDEEAQEQELLDWVECMRDEGVEISDPTRDEDGNLVIEGPGIRIGSPSPAEEGSGPASESVDSEDLPAGEEIDPEAMEAAHEACGPPPQLGATQFSDDPEARQAIEDASLEFAECMRDEGIEDFPDPDFSNSGPGGEARTESGGSGDDGRTVVLGPFGEIDMDDPEVAAAFEACQDIMASAREGATGGPGSANEGSGG